MTQTRKTYKTTKQNPKKYTSITFRVTEEEKTIIQKHAKETGCRTESEYIRLLCQLQETNRITNEELLKIRTDITYCREWIEQHKNQIDTAITAINIAVKLFS